MNEFYKIALETQHERRPFFNKVLGLFNNQPIKACIVGVERNLDPRSIFGDGWFSLYVADYIRKNGGHLALIDIDPVAIKNAKFILSDFLDIITFVNANGFDYLRKNNGFDLAYLDSGDNPNFMYEEYRALNRTKTTIFCDDFASKGLRLRQCYPDFELLKCPGGHEMALYKKVTDNEKTFKIGNLELEYVREDVNNAYVNERACELALGKYFLQKHNYQVKEVGAVMCYYGEQKHEIYDPYDHHPLCKKIDLFDLNLRDCNCLSISTIEHILNDDGYNQIKDETASFRAVQKIINESKNYLITFPIGSHPKLQEQILNSNLKYKILRRKNSRGATNNWEEVPNTEENMFEIYGHFEYGLDLYGNALCIVLITNDLDILA